MNQLLPLWVPTEEAVKRANVTSFMDWLGWERGLAFSDYRSLWRWSVECLEEFWESIWRYYSVRSSTPYDSPLAQRVMPGARWFAGARLNCAEHVLAPATDVRPAIIFAAEGQEPVEISWVQLRARVGTFAAALRAMGVERGDRVAAHVPNRPEAVVAMLAVTSIGAVWAACAPHFGAQSVIDRFSQVEPKVLIAVDGYRFGGKGYDRRTFVADLRRALPSVRRTILVRSLFPDERPPPALHALPFDQLVGGKPQEPEFAHVDFDHPLWILFFSGTTGILKGMSTGTAGSSSNTSRPWGCASISGPATAICSSVSQYGCRVGAGPRRS